MYADSASIHRVDEKDVTYSHTKNSWASVALVVGPWMNRMNEREA